MLDDLAKIPKEIVDFCREIYGDLAKPGIRQVGRAFEILLAFIPASLWKLEAYQKEKALLLQRRLDQFRENISSTPLENIVPIVPDLGVPIIERLSYTLTDEIAELYLDLLKSNATRDKAGFCHPRMISTIQSLSPDEAKIIRWLGSLDKTVYVLPSLKMSYGTREEATEIFNKYFNIEEAIDLEHPDEILIYIDNLVGLEILEFRKELITNGAALYDQLSRTRFVTKEKEMYLQTHGAVASRDFIFYHGVLIITQYGRLLIDVCATTKAN